MLLRPLLASLLMVGVCSSLSAAAADAQPAAPKAPAPKAPAPKPPAQKPTQNDATRPWADPESGAKHTAGQPTTRTASTRPAHATDRDDADTSSPKPRAGRQMRIAGIATAGAGVVLIGVGAVFGIKAGSLS